MLSYQHLYHAGNLADVHKHAALAWVLDYLTQKPKPLSYLETHAGRGLYDLQASEAIKTGEAAAGIERVAHWFTGHPYGDILSRCRAAHGPTSYPGSPLIASFGLRTDDTLHLAELHPQERAALEIAVPSAKVHARDGFEMAMALLPPTPRRGLILIDPSYEVKSDYDDIPAQIAKMHKAWNVGVVMLWYPVLTDNRHKSMLNTLKSRFETGLSHEVRFSPAREGHKMVGSGLFLLNPPWGLGDELDRLGRLYETL